MYENLAQDLVGKLKLPVEVLLRNPSTAEKEVADKALDERVSRGKKLDHQIYFHRQRLGYCTRDAGYHFTVDDALAALKPSQRKSLERSPVDTPKPPGTRKSKYRKITWLRQKQVPIIFE